MNVPFGRKARAVAAALLIVATATLALPETASANGGHGRCWKRHRIARHASYRVHRPRYRHRYGHARYGSWAPYRVAYVRPRYRAVIVEDPYCYEDVVYDERPVYGVYRYRPAALSFTFHSGRGYGGYGDPYCGW